MSSKKKNKKSGSWKIFCTLVCGLTLLLGFTCSYHYIFDEKATTTEIETIEYYSARQVSKTNTFQQRYLSDMVPVEKRIGYKELVNDKDLSGNPIVLKVENNYFTFKKGLFAHASSTIVYDLRDYQAYPYFVTFVGINHTSNRGNGVTYHFYLSEDKKEWQEVGTGIRKNPQENATLVEIPLKGAKYLKLEVNDNGANGNDHSVFADAKLVNELNGNFVLESVTELDQEIKLKNNGQTDLNGELEQLVLKRELIRRVGQYTINSFYNESDDNAAVINWLLHDKKVLKYYILGGYPEGNSYYNSLTQLSRLYQKYQADFKRTDTTKYGTVLGDLYTRMAIALSLTHSQRVALWMQPGVKENQSDSVVRYQIYKNLHKDGKFKVTDSIDITKWFENYSVENMRFVMNNLIDDESILWLNEYVQSKIDANPRNAWGLLTPHPYMAYVWPNYGNSVYYDLANYDYFNDLFSVNGKKLYDYQITRGTLNNKIYKVWMNFRNKFGTGAVCGGISKTGSNIRATHGIAATVIGQPGHAALLYYSEDSMGRGYWNIDNDVSGWTLSEKGERMLLGWGNASYAKGSYQVVYMVLAQEVLNDYENFEKAEKLIMLAKTYHNDPVKQENLLRKALETQPINIDAWYDLIQLYNNNNQKTEKDYYRLAEELAEQLKYYPLPMYQLTNLIKPKLTSIESTYQFMLLQNRILNQAKNTPNNTADSYTVYQPSITRQEANYLLGRVDNSIAKFSFDGADAGKIVLSSRFDGNGVRWDYSLDGKKTWKEVSFTGEEEHKWQLTPKEIRQITATNDIYVHIVGVNYEEKNLYQIDISEGSLLSNIFANDLENRVVGVNLGTEWRYRENDAWTSYQSSSPDLTGNKTVQVRQAATGTSLASEPSPLFTFTLDNQPDTRKYIPVSHLSIESVSTEAVNQGGAASKAIDGNYYTRWHSAWNGTDQNRFIVIKLDQPVALSAVEFVPAGGGNGKIYDGTVYGSMDGKNWEVLSTLKNVTYTNQANTIQDAIRNTKSFEIPEAKEVQYVKIVADRSNGNWFTARAFNLYQDISKKVHPTAGIAYSVTEPTNGNVIARLINPSTKITITNNHGSDTYTFTENGKFTFEFVDSKGIKGTATAVVDWIDKDIPKASIEYELDTNHKISISLDGISEDVYLLDKQDQPINLIQVKNKKVSSISYLDDTSNVYKIVEVDSNGCITKISYTNTSGKVASVSTYTTFVTNGVVTGEEYYDNHGNPVTVTESEKEILKGLQQSITNPLEYTFEQSGDYEFKMLDKAKNIAYKSIKVDYNETNEMILTSDITYDITRLTNKNVKATIKSYVFDSKGKKTEATMVSGNPTHTFKENGKYTFQYQAKDYQEAGVFEHVSEVTWIDKVAPTAQVKYTKQENGNVLATLVNESEEIVITNNSARKEYVFTKNGTFTFQFKDMVGNVGQAVAKVNSIVEDTKPVTPNQPNKPVKPEKPIIPNDSTTSTIPNNPGNSNQDTSDLPTDEPITEDTENPGEEHEDVKPSPRPDASDKSEVNQTNISKEDKNQGEKGKKMFFLILFLILAIIIVILYVKKKRD